MSHLRTEVSDGVAYVTLNDPDRRNILSGALVTGLIDTFDRLEDRGAVSAVVLTGAGPAFCAGADVADLLAAANGDTSGVTRIYAGLDRVHRSPLVTIAAVNGPAVGAGLNLALVCDIRVAATSAWFDCRFLALGLHPGGGNLAMLHRLVGPHTAAAMALCGQRYDAAGAVAVGLALTAAADADLPTVAADLARAAAAAPRPVLLLTKRSLREEPALTREQAIALEAQRQLWSLRLDGTAARLRGPARSR